jgi:RNA polymerase sigma-70 factor, ECF subfamily
MPFREALWADQVLLDETLAASRGPLKSRVERAVGRQDASEVVQEILLKAFERLDTFRGLTAAQFKAWLQAISRRCVSAYFRLQNARKRAAKLVPLLTDSGHELALPAPGPGPVEAAINRELLGLLGQLTPPHQEVIWLYYWAGMTLREIADRVGEEEDTVRARRNAALKVLRGIAGKALGPEE